MELSTIYLTLLSVVIGLMAIGLIRQQTLLNRIAGLTLATYDLMDKKLGLQLKLDTLISRRLADTTNNPDDAKVAEAVENAYRDYLKSG